MIFILLWGLSLDFFMSLGWDPLPGSWLIGSSMQPGYVFVETLVVLIAIIAIAWYAKRQGHSFWLMFALGFFTSPVLQMIVCLALWAKARAAGGAALPSETRNADDSPPLDGAESASGAVRSPL
jgi:hypothetical protein